MVLWTLLAVAEVSFNPIVHALLYLHSGNGTLIRLCLVSVGGMICKKDEKTGIKSNICKRLDFTLVNLSFIKIFYEHHTKGFYGSERYKYSNSIHPKTHNMMKVISCTYHFTVEQVVKPKITYRSSFILSPSSYRETIEY